MLGIAGGLGIDRGGPLAFVTDLFNGFNRVTGDSFTGGPTAVLDNTGSLITPPLNRMGIEGGRLSYNLAEGVIPSPEGFPWVPVTVRATAGVFTVDNFNLSQFAPTGKTYYVSLTGNDANDGLTPETALRLVKTAVLKADVDVVVVAPGEYEHNQGWDNFTPTRNVAIKASGNGVILSKHQTVSWSADATYTNTYKATRSGCYMVRDKKTLDQYGDPTELVQKATLAEANATPNSWYTDNVSIWIRLNDSRVPDADVRNYLDAGNGVITGSASPRIMYLENIAFHGGSYAFAGTATGAGLVKVYNKGCEFKYAKNNGYAITGNIESYSQGSSANSNLMDGFNYHASGAYIPKAFEIDCTGRSNGLSSSLANPLNNQSNGSTSHDAAPSIRINGVYHSNRGPNVADVIGTKTSIASWCVNCKAYNSLASVANSQRANFFTENLMYLDYCQSSGSLYDLVAYVAAANVKATNLLTNYADLNNGGTITLIGEPSWFPTASNGSPLWSSQSVRTRKGVVAKYASTFRGYLNEPARTNYFLNSAAPVTQNITTTAQQYTVSVRGTGSITLSGTATGVATEASPLTVTATAGTLTCTVAGSLTHAQVEAGAFKTSPITTAGATVTRAATAYLRPTTNILWANDFAVWGRVVPLAAGQSNQWLFGTQVDVNNETFLSANGTSTALSFVKKTSGVSVSLFPSYAHAAGVGFEYMLYQSSSYGMGAAIKQDGGAWAAWAAKNDADGRLPAVIANTFQIGGRGNGLGQFAANYPFTAIIRHNDPKTYLEQLRTRYP